MNLKDRNLPFSDFYQQLNTQKNNSFLLFDIFLDRLRQLGFTLTPDHYIRVYEIVHPHGQKRMPAELKYLLCPILATSPIQQKQFYEEFDLFFPCMDDSGKNISEISESHHLDADDQIFSTDKSYSNTIPKWPYWFFGILFFGVIITAVFMFDKNTPQQKITSQTVSQKKIGVGLEGTT
ncbi:hypothetical protein MHK_005098, partial [Candidatus Magnetomorum sp. HK-1]